MLYGIASAQDNATVQTESSGAFHPGGQIIFKLKLDEPLPKGAHFDLRISPVSKDEEISLGSGEPVDEKLTEFRVKGSLPEGALPGDWHISVIWLFLPGSGWQGGDYWDCAELLNMSICSLCFFLSFLIVLDVH